MAEQLGQAELVITVNDADALRKLGELKKQVADLEGQAGRQVSRTRTTTKASPAEAERKRAERAAEQAANKRVSIQNRLNILEAKGVDVTAFRLRASRANEAAQQSQFDTARQINAQLSRALSIEENRLRVSAAQAAQLKRQEASARGTASTVIKTAQKPTGVGFATTPEQILASRGGIQKGAAESLRAREAATDKLYQLSNRINILEAKGVDISSQRVKLEQIIEAGKQGQLGTERQLIQNLARQLSVEENALKVARAREATEKRRAQGSTGAASRVRSPATQAAADVILERRARLRSLQTAGGGGGGLTSFLRDVRQREEGERRIAAIRKAGYKDAEFAEKTLRSFVEQRAKRETSAGGGLRRRAGGALGSAIIGGGFPLLFGQGVGAAAGGLAGGAIGGAIGGQFGFGLSIVGTIVGDAFDEALNKGKTLAAGLSDPIGKFEELRQAGLISSKALEKNISSLIAQGREAEAAAKIQLDLATSFGDTSELTALNTAYDELGRAFSQLSVITAKFVAGPLADFINKLSGSFTAQSTQALLKERLVGAPQAVRKAAFAARRAAFKEASQAGTPGGAAITAGNQAALQVVDELLGKTRQVQQAEAAVAAAISRQNGLRSLAFRQIDAQVQGYDRLNLELEKQRIEQQRLQDLSVPGADVERINTEAAQATYRVQSQINDLAKERVAIATEEAAKYQLAGEKLKQELQAVQALAALSQNAQRTAQFAVQQSTLSTIQGIEASVGDAQRREREIGAQIDAARLRGGDAGEQEAARLVNEQKTAAQQTRLELEKGSLALTQAGIKLREDVDAAFLNLQKLRTGAGGPNQYLSPQDRVNQERQTFKTLLPRFRVAQEQFQQLRGVNYAPEFTGTTAGVNQSILQFIDAVNAEQQAFDVSADTQKALSDNTAALAKINTDLAAVVQKLTDKNWIVQLNQGANGMWSASGDMTEQSNRLFPVTP